MTWDYTGRRGVDIVLHTAKAKELGALGRERCGGEATTGDGEAAAIGTLPERSFDNGLRPSP